VLIGTLWEKAKDSWVEDGGRQPAQAWRQVTCFNTFVPLILLLPRGWPDLMMMVPVAAAVKP